MNDNLTITQILKTKDVSNNSKMQNKMQNKKSIIFPKKTNIPMLSIRDIIITSKGLFIPWIILLIIVAGIIII
jgi:hypothetical protein